MKVRELMYKDVIAVAPETTLKEVASLLVEHRISGVPVVDESRRVLGVVSEADIVLQEQATRPGSRLLDWLLGGGMFDRGKLAARTAEEAMSSPPITIGAEKEVFQAARLMTEQEIKRLPVVDAEGTLVGIVTRSDLVRAFARPDDELAREIEDLMHRTLLIVDEDVQIDVREGAVHLAGELERRSDAELLSRIAARIPGVVSVESTLR
ncbi:MAG TPA: CBS domain-containing protein [Gaiellaceae bacterium]|nr:CBS domain-containing protein [Gaiellaceae bacterium]